MKLNMTVDSVSKGAPRVTSYGASAVIVEASDVIGNRLSFVVGAADAPRPDDPVEVIVTIAPVR